MLTLLLPSFFHHTRFHSKQFRKGVFYLELSFFLLPEQMLNSSWEISPSSSWLASLVSHITVPYCGLSSFPCVSTGTRGLQVKIQVAWFCNSSTERDINPETTQVKPPIQATKTLLLGCPSAVLMTIWCSISQLHQKFLNLNGVKGESISWDTEELEINSKDPLRPTYLKTLWNIFPKIAPSGMWTLFV